MRALEDVEEVRFADGSSVRVDGVRDDLPQSAMRGGTSESWMLNCRATDGSGLANDSAAARPSRLLDSSFSSWIPGRGR